MCMLLCNVIISCIHLVAWWFCTYKNASRVSSWDYWFFFSFPKCIRSSSIAFTCNDQNIRITQQLGLPLPACGPLHLGLDSSLSAVSSQPPIMGNVDPSKIDEIRRTVYVGNLNSQVSTKTGDSFKNGLQFVLCVCFFYYYLSFYTNTWAKDWKWTLNALASVSFGLFPCRPPRQSSCWSFSSRSARWGLCAWQETRLSRHASLS